jgi:hypothetical protein
VRQQRRGHRPGHDQLLQSSTTSRAAFATAVSNCSKQSNGKYTITYNKLPKAADDQRLQLARRLAAADARWTSSAWT